jgi:hypothetical protein
MEFDCWIKLYQNTSKSFPSLSEEEIRCLAIGVYQVNLAKSYVQEHLKELAEFTVYVCKQDEHLIFAKLQSRHVSSKAYLFWHAFGIF